MRSVAGPFLGTLGASALTVGLVTGAGEALALVLRLVAGPYADRSGRHWRLTTIGYAMTAVCVPLLAVTPFLGAAGLGVASALVLAERTGKAVRSPRSRRCSRGWRCRSDAAAGSASTRRWTRSVRSPGRSSSRGRRGHRPGVAGLRRARGARRGLAGAAGPAAPARARRRAPGAATRGGDDPPARRPERLPRRFHLFAGACAASTLGLMTFGVISYASVDEGLVPLAVAPVVYAGAMAVAALGALGDRARLRPGRARVLLVLPPLVAAVPALVFTDRLALVLRAWRSGAWRPGVLDSTVKALVADLVPRRVARHGVRRVRGRPGGGGAGRWWPGRVAPHRPPDGPGHDRRSGPGGGVAAAAARPPARVATALRLRAGAVS